MRIQRRAQFASLWRSRELMEPKKNVPVLPSLVRNSQFVARDVERRALPAVGRFHRDKAVLAIWGETCNFRPAAIEIVTEN